MHYDISGTRLILTPSRKELEVMRTTLAENPEEFDSQAEEDILWEHLVANSNLQMTDAACTGDLTTAPMVGLWSSLEFLGVIGWEDPERNCLQHVGRWDGRDWYRAVTHRWAWMGYQVRPLQRELLEKDRAVLLGGPTIFGELLPPGKGWAVVHDEKGVYLGRGPHWSQVASNPKLYPLFSSFVDVEDLLYDIWGELAGNEHPSYLALVECDPLMTQQRLASEDEMIKAGLSAWL